MEEQRGTNTTRLYNRILEQEEKLEKLAFDLCSSTRSGDHGRAAWLESRHTLKLVYEELFVSDPEFFHKGHLLGTFWMRLYYGIVKRVRAILDGPHHESRKGLRETDVQLIKEDIIGILEEGMGFFMIILYRLEDEYVCDAAPRIGGDSFAPRVYSAKRKRSRAPEDLIRSLMYECLIYLGDLSRYRCAFLSNAGPEDGLEMARGLSLSAGQYRKATRLMPDHGHSYNQLAVLSCLQDDVLSGVTLYLRASLCVHSFGKSAENLLTLCRRVVNIPEERLALAQDSVMAAVLGLLLRLVAALIVHELSRSGQSVHLDGIRASLGRLLAIAGSPTLFSGHFDEKDESSLIMLTSSLIFTTDFLQRASKGTEAASHSTFLSTSQCILLEWIFALADKILRHSFTCPMESPGLKSLSLIVLWLVHSDIIQRLKNTTIDPRLLPSFDLHFHNFLRSVAEAVSRFEDIQVDSLPEHFLLTEDSAVVGTRAFTTIFMDRTAQNDDRLRVKRILAAVHSLHERDELLVFDHKVDAFYCRDDYEKMVKRELMGSRLAKQRLTTELSTLQGRPNNDNDGHPALWHLIETESIVDNWTEIEPLIEARKMRLIITLSALRYLDHAKNDRAGTSRKIMRYVSSQTPSNLIHLQHPDETIDEDSANLPPTATHRVAFLAAIRYFTHLNHGFAPLVVLSRNIVLNEILNQQGIEYIRDISSYLCSLNAP